MRLPSGAHTGDDSLPRTRTTRALRDGPRRRTGDRRAGVGVAVADADAGVGVAAGAAPMPMPRRIADGRR